MLEILHFIHITAAAIFVGSVVFFDWVLGAALGRQSADERKNLILAVRPFSGPVLIWSLTVTLTAGIGRLWVSGAVTEWGDLWQGYGLRAVAALIIVVASEGLAAPIRKRLRAAIDQGDTENFRRHLTRQRALNSVVLIVVLLLMASMRMGW